MPEVINESIILGLCRAATCAGGLAFEMPTDGCQPECWVLPRLSCTCNSIWDIDAWAAWLRFTPASPAFWDHRPAVTITHPDLSRLRARQVRKLKYDRQLHAMGCFHPGHVSHYLRKCACSTGRGGIAGCTRAIRKQALLPAHQP
jgi:hypothetical protein